MVTPLSTRQSAMGLISEVAVKMDEPDIDAHINYELATAFWESRADFRPSQLWKTPRMHFPDGTYIELVGE